MKHAYLITAHNNFKVLEICLELIDDERNVIFIMIDNKLEKNIYDDLSKKLKNVLKKSDLIFTSRININWGGLSQIKAELILLEHAVNYHIEFQYYHYLQGSDLPLKSQEYIHRLFMENEGKEFIEFDKKQYNSSIYKYCYKHFFIDNKYYRNNLVLKYLNHTLAHFQRKTRIKRKPPYPLYHGSALFSITNQFANYIVNIKDEIINDYKNTLACDEVFLQSIVMQSKFKDNIYKFEKKLNGNLRYIDKNTTDRQKNSPYVFKFKDFDRLMQLDSDLIFARKFSENEDMEIVMSIKSAVLSNSR